MDFDIQPDFGDSLYEPVTEIPEPATEIPVTDEMRRIGGDILRSCREMEVFDEQAADASYRAMVALAPTELYREDERRIDALEAENAALTKKIEAAETMAWDHVHRRSKFEAENVALRAQLATFTGAVSMPADLPNPPRRPDGTLVPAARSWSPPKTAGDARRIGG